MSISVCMIVKNEEELLPDCLASIKGWVDEIIVVDTGSTDKTIEIAKGYGAVIYEIKWEDDFSKARNYSMSKATKEWIFIIDADERVAPDDGSAIGAVLDKTEHDVIAVDVLSVYGPKRTVRCQSPGLRFFRRTYKPKYVKPVHNQPVVHKGTVIYRVPFKIYHLGFDLPPEVMAQKDLRRTRMCKKLTETEPESAEAWYHYARALKVKDGKFNKGQQKEIIESLQRGINLCNGVNDRQNMYIQLLSLMAWIQHIIGEPKIAIDYGKRALIFKHNYLDVILLIGIAYTYKVDAEEGERWLKRYLQEQEMYDFSSKLDSISMEHGHERTLVYRTLIDIEEAKIVKRRVEQTLP